VTGEVEAEGWAWFETGQPGERSDDEVELCRRFAKCFAGPDGEIVLDHLRRLILDRRCPPSATGAELRHLEGQRFAVAYIAQMVERGRA
jgi:hypothetical protein